MLALALAGFAAGCSTTADILPPATMPAVVQVDSDASKEAAFVVDATSRRVLYQSHPDAQRYPASLTKMMTLYMLFDAMEAGRVSATAQIPVSAYAASQPPTKIGFRPGETIDVDSAIRALVTKSANDVAVAVGEYLGGGSEERFANIMTGKARSIGMKSTVFRNASGLPDAGQHTTARDMAVLGLALRQRFPQYYSYFSTQSFTFRGRLVRGHNDLLATVPGVDGIKTGYIRASGFNIVTSVDEGGRRLVVVVFGGRTARARNATVADLIARYLPQTSAGSQTVASY